MSQAVNWQKKIFQFDPSYNISEVATAIKWCHIYDKVTQLNSKNKNENVVKYLESPHISTMKRKTAKEDVMDKLANPPLQQINESPETLLAMAEFQGAVLGTYLQKL